MESRFGNSEFEMLWTAKMGMFAMCNLMCGFGPSAKVQIQAFQHIRGSQWNFILVGCGRLVGPCREVSGGEPGTRVIKVELEGIEAAW